MSIFKAGGSAGVTAYAEISDAGVVTFSDGTNSTTITPGGSTAVVNITATGNATLGNAAADTHILTGHVDIDSDRTTAGSGLDVDGRINGATAAFAAIDVTAVQLTTVRTSGNVDGVKVATTSLVGDLGGVYSGVRVAAPTDGGGSATHNAITVEAGHDALIDASAAATGQNDIVIPDNVASALEIREGANMFLRFVTTDNAELVSVGKLLGFSVVSFSMAATPHALVYGTAGTDQTQVTGNLITVDPAAATRELRLPATATAGIPLLIFNVSESHALSLTNAAGSAVGGGTSIPAGRGAVAVSNGAGWGILLSA